MGSLPPDRAIPSVPGVGPVYLAEFHGEVDPGLAAFLKRVLGEHGEGEIVLLDINTLGGRLDSALEIRDALLESKATSVCWVHPRAISAGALITLACDVVAMSPDGSMGAATPVYVSSTGTLSPVDAKITSYMRQEMAQTARMQKRDPRVAEAMVDAEVEIAGLIPKGRLLTLDTATALQWHIADYEAATPADLWRSLGRDAPRIEQVRPTGTEALAGFVSDPIVSTLLIVFGLLGIVVEVFHPTHGAALLFGLSCLGFFFFGNEVVELAGWMEVGIVALGLVLIALEYAFPGHTIFGVVGLQMVLLGVFLGLVSLQRLPLSVAWEVGIIPRALASVFGALLCTMAGAAAVIHYAPRTRFGKALVLEAVVPEPEQPVRGIGIEALVGLRGVALSDLRPVGKIEVVNKRVEARSERGFISAGRTVAVIRVDGTQVLVREIEVETGNSATPV